MATSLAALALTTPLITPLAHQLVATMYARLTGRRLPAERACSYVQACAIDCTGVTP
ncbi:hypothetical protein [Streptomyces sp. RB17]|uniref:hypothetical protein n=1 Tax=Streptomyces sp. RB17 TaxID=2585197 RepID=UPI001296537D|nr:hypothetical protein [Streptomyces sp. RB17]